MKRFITVNVSGQMRENCEPYIQAARYEGDLLVLEAISDNFIDNPLSLLARNTLEFLLWREPNEYNENHHIVLGPDRPTNDLIARFMILTLQDVYGASPENKFEWSLE